MVLNISLSVLLKLHIGSLSSPEPASDANEDQNSHRPVGITVPHEAKLSSFTPAQLGTSDDGGIVPGLLVSHLKVEVALSLTSKVLLYKEQCTRLGRTPGINRDPEK